MKIAINGFGRIGRQILRRLLESKSPLEVVAINDLTDPAMLAHLFAFDSTFGRYPGTVEAKEHSIVVDGKEILITSEKDPAQLPWGKMGAEMVLECTGYFTDREKAALHLQAGAKRVILSAPGKGVELTVVMGVNESQYDPAKHQIVSNASCTTNCLAPVAKVLDDAFGIGQGVMTTVHAVTNDQQLLDLPHKDYRRARSAIQSMIPTSTGAAKAIGEVLPGLKGKLDGLSVRVPLPTVSLIDLTVTLKKAASKEEINQAFQDYATLHPEILQLEKRPLVSKDFQMDPHSASVDAQSTMVMGGNMAKVLAWYDNEWGYSCRMVDLAEYIAEKS